MRNIGDKITLRFLTALHTRDHRIEGPRQILHLMRTAWGQDAFHLISAGVIARGKTTCCKRVCHPA